MGEADSPLGRDFCLTLVRGPGRDEVIERLGGTERVDIVGASRLHEAADLVRWRPDVSENGAFYADPGDRLGAGGGR
ncbi:DUF6461 domain-containing protein [Actinoplanes sp. NBRC 103695]|uniref:DUF6461 domain-containing protein n=1 Tax=Actinoplanes sp. NBRC 103695 TaxID=3032202 RepID=UPI0024A14B5E|nr:DUF6461 domain-containing protein [Actinoplanes sp. NBRC 103695]GLZ00020.1 hypothetical protein Acsp02_72720 [Actinoplanes sp. NBRC 103695]